MLRPKTKDQVLRPVHPNCGIEIEYRRRLTKLIDEMDRSIVWFVSAAYKRNTPEIATDESPAAAMRAAIRRLARRWNARFDEAAKELAAYFAMQASERSDAALKAILKKGGFSVSWTMTRAQNDIVQATVAQNVSLIKSIAQQHLTNVEGLVMRSVQTGRDLGQLTKDLQEQHGVSKRRAAFIARDQSNKATSALVRARYIECGITDAVWLHSGGGRHGRPSHVKAGREKTRYNVSQGWFDPSEQKYIHPGELINCRCVSKAVVSGF